MGGAVRVFLCMQCPLDWNRKQMCLNIQENKLFYLFYVCMLLVLGMKVMKVMIQRRRSSKISSLVCNISDGTLYLQWKWKISLLWLLFVFERATFVATFSRWFRSCDIALHIHQFRILRNFDVLFFKVRLSWRSQTSNGMMSLAWKELRRRSKKLLFFQSNSPTFSQVTSCSSQKNNLLTFSFKIKANVW